MNASYEISVGTHPDVIVGFLPASKELPMSGDRLTVCVPFFTLAGVQYLPGDQLELIERTDEAPHLRRSSLGNWRVQCKVLKSVWTNIEYMLAIGLVSKEQS